MRKPPQWHSHGRSLPELASRRDTTGGRSLSIENKSTVAGRRKEMKLPFNGELRMVYFAPKSLRKNVADVQGVES